MNGLTSVHTVACFVKAKSTAAFAAVSREQTENIDCAQQTRIGTHLTTYTHVLFVTEILSSTITTFKVTGQGQKSTNSNGFQEAS